MLTVTAKQARERSHAVNILRRAGSVSSWEVVTVVRAYGLLWAMVLHGWFPLVELYSPSVLLRVICLAHLFLFLLYCFPFVPVDTVCTVRIYHTATVRSSKCLIFISNKNAIKTIPSSGPITIKPVKQNPLTPSRSAEKSSLHVIKRLQSAGCRHSRLEYILHPLLKKNYHPTDHRDGNIAVKCNKSVKK